jgi:hypothetical protein
MGEGMASLLLVIGYCETSVAERAGAKNRSWTFFGWGCIVTVVE